MQKNIYLAGKKQRKRVKTDYSNNEQSNDAFINKNSIFDYNYLSIVPETFSFDFPQGLDKNPQFKSIQQIFKQIQNPVQYDQMPTQLITAQKRNLQNQVKFLNKQVNDLMKRKMSKIQNGQSRKLQRSSHNSRFKYNQWDNTGMQMQTINSRKFILLLKDQFQFLNTKLQKIQKSDYKTKYDNLIKQTKENITKMRMLLFQKKRKNVFATKKIVELDKKEIHKVYFDMQQDYVTLSKKKQDYTKKVDKLIKQNSNVNDQQAQLQEQELSLKNQACFILKTLPNQMEEQHYRVMYQTKCRKMQLSLKKRQRDQQGFKRKYYGILKDYQKMIQNSKLLDQKLNKLQNQLDTSHYILRETKNKIQNNKTTNVSELKQQITRIWKAQSEDKQISYKREEDDSCNQGFLLTQLNNKQTSRITKANTPNMNQKVILLPQLGTKSNSYYTSTQKNKTRIKTDYNRKQQIYTKELDNLTKGNTSLDYIKSNSKQTSRNQRTNQQKYSNKNNNHQQQYQDDFEIQNPLQK